MRTVLGSTRRLAARFIAVTTSAIVFASLLATPSMARQSYAGIVMDAKTGKILYSEAADAKRYPASLTKMMTLYMMFDAIEHGKLSKKSRITFSKRAEGMAPSKLGVKAGQSISAEQAIYALVTKSANDVACAVGETLGGSETNFAKMMTAKARSIGMKNTTFRNASGLPDSGQVTTAKDMAILGMALREHFPQHYAYFSTRSFKYGKKNMGNHNKLLGRVRGVDGIKTGYTRASGFNLVSSVQDNGRSIVAVVMGGKTGKSRDQQMAALIQKYLSKASKGKDQMIIAKGKNSTVFASIFKKSSKNAVPEPRPEVAPVVEVVDTIVTAAVAPQAEVSNVVVPTPAPDIAETQVVSTNQANAPRGGWHVQIGAMPSEENAISQLENARKKLPAILASVDNYTETVSKNGSTLYRARFAGFSSKDAAWNACSQLKKAKFSCLALQQN